MIYAGVYEIVNKNNGKRYIGSSQNIRNRFYQHKSMLINGNHHCIYLQRAWDKYGKDSFIMRPLVYCDKDMTLYYEQIMLNKFHPEYNIANCAEASARGAKRSLETRKKISEIQKGKKRSIEAIKKSAMGHIGLTHSDETKESISKSIKEWHKTENGKIAKQKAIEAKNKKIICLNNNITYSSIKDASKDLGINRSKISLVAKGKRNHTGGFRFIYAGGDK